MSAPRGRSKERVAISDIVEIKLNKADGTVITNEPKKITVKMLEEIIDALHEGEEDQELSETVSSHS
jgi:hypothetical protein